MGKTLMGQLDEFKVLENLSAGKKARPLPPKFSRKYQYYKKGSARSQNKYANLKNDQFSNEVDYHRKTGDMLHTAQRKKQAILKITGYYKGKKTKLNFGYTSFILPVVIP